MAVRTTPLPSRTLRHIEANEAEARRAIASITHTGTLVSFYTPDGSLLYANPAAAALLCDTGDCFVERFADRAEGEAVWQRVAAGERVRVLFQARTPEGLRWHNLDALTICDPVTGEPAILVHERDITTLKEIEGELRERERQLVEAQAVARLSDWHYDVERGVLRVSQAFATICGFDSLEQPLLKVIGRFHPEDQTEILDALDRAVNTTEPIELTARLTGVDGGTRFHWLRGQARRDATGKVVAIVGMSRDVTDDVVARKRMEALAHNDSLTGLANRACFVEKLALAMGPSGSPTGALILIDLDGFKEINDTRGHAAGDMVLREVGQRLRKLARPDDVVARLGGDEFAMILHDLADPVVLDQRARAVVDVLSSPVLADGALMSVGASVGLSTWPTDGHDPESLQRNADLALYSVKGEGGDGATFFSRGMRLAVEERRRIYDDLRYAIERGELDVYYQPLVELESRRIAGFEALVRWDHPVCGIISPDSFVPIAESSGLIRPLGAYVLRTAIGQIRRWLDAGLDCGRVAVNLGAGQLRGSDLVTLVDETLKSADVSPDRLEIEVTETVTLGRRATEVIAILEQLHDLGVAIVLDDFGTGHASLTHLKRLPVDKLKIDRSFVADIERDTSNAAIVRAVLGLGRSLNMRVVAEGVETETQLRFLGLHGCDYGQGYLFGRPMPREAATTWLRAMQDTVARA